jgi:hypothetical protein
LDEPGPEERHLIYGMKWRAIALLDGSVEVNGITAPAEGVGALELTLCR